MFYTIPVGQSIRQYSMKLVALVMIYRMVICLTMSALPDVPLMLAEELAPAFFSKIFQNFKLSSAAITEG